MKTNEGFGIKNCLAGHYDAACLVMAVAFPLHLLIFAAPYGLAVHYDSAVYLNSALNILAGHGYTVNLTGGALKPAVWFPPGYPMILAGFLKAIPHLGQALVLINAVFMGLTIWTVSRLAKRYAGPSLAGAAACVALFALSIVNLEIHTWAQSEPPFLFFTLAGLYFAARHIDEGNPQLLVFAALACALAALTRYAGVALIGAVCLWLLLDRTNQPSVRGRRTFGFASMSLAPLAAFIVRNRLAGSGYTGRPMTVHVLDGTNLAQLANSVSGVVVPGSDRFRVFPGQEYVVLAAALLALAAVAVAYIRQRAVFGQEDAPPRSLGLFLLFPAVYVLMLAGLITFVDSTIVFDVRLMSVAFVPVFVFGAGVLCHLRLSGPGLSRAFTALVCVHLVLFAGAYSAWTWYMAANGRGQNSRKYLSPKANEFLASVMGTADVYSNNVEGLYFLHQRPVRLYKDLCQRGAPGRPCYIVHLDAGDPLVLSAIAWSGNRALPDCVAKTLVLRDGPTAVYRVEAGPATAASQ